MSQDLLTGRTGVAWAPNFAKYDVGPTAAFIPNRPFLPNAPWDIGQRVQCLRDILDHSGFSRYVSWVEFEPATLAMIESFHSPDYIQSVMTQSRGDETGAYDAALLGVGAVTQLVRDVFDRKLSNGYALVRPVGHHADRGRGWGGCVFANGVFAAMEARQRGAQRILYVDWDAHHGNSQQGAFWKDRNVLTISIHQAQKVPPLTSGLDARGEQEGFGS